jgi:hypothetical protein
MTHCRSETGQPKALMAIGLQNWRGWETLQTNGAEIGMDWHLSSLLLRAP